MALREGGCCAKQAKILACLGAMLGPGTCLGSVGHIIGPQSEDPLGRRKGVLCDLSGGLTSGHDGLRG
jgi:hypothetical protein